MLAISARPLASTQGMRIRLFNGSQDWLLFLAAPLGAEDAPHTGNFQLTVTDRSPESDVVHAQMRNPEWPVVPPTIFRKQRLSIFNEWLVMSRQLKLEIFGTTRRHQIAALRAVHGTSPSSVRRQSRRRMSP
jgi:hypothetical protein